MLFDDEQCSVTIYAATIRVKTIQVNDVKQYKSVI